MTARPETLEVRHETWGEAIVLRYDTRNRAWPRWDDQQPKRNVSVWRYDRHGYVGGVRRDGASWLTTKPHTTPQAAADALAVLIHETPELRHLAPGGAA